jgi:hypothetical protein
MELDFMLSDCENIQEWIKRVDAILFEYSLDYDLDYKKLNAKAIRYYRI